MDVRPLEPFGAEVTGVDLGCLDAVAANRLRYLFAQHHVLVVRHQALGTDHQVAATSVFGPVLDERGTGARHTFVSNVRADAVAPEGELTWHQDGAFLADPFPAIVLFGVEVGAGAAPTCFASNALAFEALPHATRSRIDGLRAEHVFSASMRRSYAGGAAHDGDPEPSAVHPVLMHHLATGRPYLYVNGLMTRRVVDLHDDASDALLEELQTTIYDDRRVLVHHWQTGDFVVWDNLAVQHRRPSGAGAVVRDLRRTIVGGDRTASQYAAFLSWLRAT